MRDTNLLPMFAGLGDTAIPNARDIRCKALMEIVKLDLFYTEILNVARNGLLQPKRLVDALVLVDGLTMPDSGARPYNWNRGGNSTLHVATSLGATIRKGLHILRLVKTDSCARHVYRDGLCSASVAVIDKLLAAISIGPCSARLGMVEAMLPDQRDGCANNRDIFEKVLAGELGGMRSGSHDAAGAPPPTRSCLEPPSYPGDVASAASSPSTPNKAAATTSLPTKTFDRIFDSPAIVTPSDMYDEVAKSKPEANERVRREEAGRPVRAPRAKTAARSAPRSPGGFVRIEVFKKSICRRPKEVKKILLRSWAFKKVFMASRIDGLEVAQATENAREAARVAYRLVY